MMTTSVMGMVLTSVIVELNKTEAISMNLQPKRLGMREKLIKKFSSRN